MPAPARAKRFKFIAFIRLVFFYPSRYGRARRRGAIVDPIILQLLIIKSFAKLANRESDRIIGAS
jgi:hypothetical protein